MDQRKTQQIAIGVVAGVLTAIGFLTLSDQQALARPAMSPMEVAVASRPSIPDQELLRDMAGKYAPVPSDGTEPHVPASLITTTRDLYKTGQIRTAGDYHRAACILSRSESTKDVQLAHDLAVSALALGDTLSGPVVAATEDRFLVLSGKPQRFGTQYSRSGGKLSEVATDGEVTDSHRQSLNLPDLRALRTASKDEPMKQILLCQPQRVSGAMPLPRLAP